MAACLCQKAVLTMLRNTGRPDRVEKGVLRVGLKAGAFTESVKMSN